MLARFLSGSLVFALVALAAQANANEPGAPQAPKAAESVNRFGLELYKTCGAEGNLLFSPHSIWTALAMTREGAKGPTAAELNGALHFPKGEALAKAQSTLRDGLEPWVLHGRKSDNPAYTLEVANRLWGAKDAVFHEPFTKRLAGAYAAPLTRLDFTQPEAARQLVNKWVETKTHERIKEFLPKRHLNMRTRLLLVNATYFSASWQTPFEARNTLKGAWHGVGGASSEAMFMNNTGLRAYAETKTAQIVELNYRARKTSMIVVLPRQQDGLAKLEGSLSAKTLKGWIGALKHKRVAVALPRFAFTSPSLELKPQLSKLGLKRAFEPSLADFSGMSAEKPLFIGSVLHKATISVDEKGTEAAAATAVMMMAGGAPPSTKPLTFRADRPFLFFIRHRDTGVILFMGRTVKPE